MQKLPLSSKAYQGKQQACGKCVILRSCSCFAKGHSASYAVESYQSLYLKAYYPLEFYVGGINNFGGFYRTEFYVHAARMSGAVIHAPCVNHSEYHTSIRGTSIYLGLIHTALLEQKLAQRIVAERQSGGDYRNLHDFTERMAPGLEQLKILVRIGAFRLSGKNRKELMWEIHWLHNKQKPVPAMVKLFREPPKEYHLPELTYDKLEDAFEQMELLGFPLCNPFTLVAEETVKSGGLQLMARHLQKLTGRLVQILGYLVTIKPTRTIKDEYMSLDTWLGREGFFFDTVHFTEAARKYPFQGRGIYRLQGVVTNDFGAKSMDVQRMEKIPYLPDPKWD
ncbi:MAG: hypothetical protein KG003_06480 [Bacteroidetes bacterium]|nr:hypothetical protein [Bacteroidota bacterium]